MCRGGSAHSSRLLDPEDLVILAVQFQLDWIIWRELDVLILLKLLHHCLNLLNKLGARRQFLGFLGHFHVSNVIRLDFRKTSRDMYVPLRWSDGATTQHRGSEDAESIGLQLYYAALVAFSVARFSVSR